MLPLLLSQSIFRTSRFDLKWLRSLENTPYPVRSVNQNMEIHEEFTNWAVERGVKINGVAAHKFEGRGLGIIATKKHEV
jgi:hypothetical protein